MAEFGPGTKFVVREPVAFPPGTRVLPEESGEDPSRVCYATPVQKGNPVCTYTEMNPVCGRPIRQQDAVSQDKDLVTCEACKAVLQGGRPTTQAVPPGPRYPGDYRRLVDSLNVEQLEAKKADLEGELAALDVLLGAARAREKKINEGAGGS